MTTPTRTSYKAERKKAVPDLELRFPPLPRTVSEVSALLAEQTDIPDTPRLIEIVHNDPVMAASVLKRINSAFFGIRRHVSDVNKAVRLLGFLEVCNIVLASAMMRLRDVVKTRTQEKIFEQIMQASVGTASYALELTNYLKIPYREIAFTSGILHASGRLVLLHNRPAEYERLWRSGVPGTMPTAESERAFFGVDHMLLGGMAVDHWHLPASVVQVVRSYLTPGHIKDPKLRSIALSVSVAASATEQLCMTPGNENLRFEAKTALRILARTSNATTQELTELIEARRTSVTDFMASMVYSP